MTALQVRDPVEPFILMKSDDFPVQNASFRRLASFRETSKRFRILARASAELRDVQMELRNAPEEYGNVSKELGDATGQRGRAGGFQKNSGESRGKAVELQNTPATRRGRAGEEPDKGVNLEKNVLTLRRKVGGIAY